MSTFPDLSIVGAPSTTSTVDVIIIGAGPAGLMAATALTRAGVSVRIVDKRDQPVMLGHADGGQPRTMEVLHSYGLYEKIREKGIDVDVQSFYAYDQEIQGLKLHQRTPTCVGPPGRFTGVAAHQGSFEQVFISDLAEHGVHVERPVAPKSLKVVSTDSEHPVEICLPTATGGEEVVHAKYAIGGDGARSWVREVLGISMEGENTEYVWGVVDLIPQTSFPDVRHLSIMQSPLGSCLIIPRERRLIRLYVQLENQPELFSKDGSIDREKVGWQKILDVARRCMVPYTIDAAEEPEWWSVYRIRQQVATRYTDPRGRVFIVGDACHTHSPKAGQGMNASINDSHNLAWKIAHVLRSWAKPELLQTYEQERRDYAQKLIAFDKVWASAVSKPLKSHPEDKNGISREELMQVVWTFGSFQSGVGIRYEPGPLVLPTHQHLAAKLVIGERLPPGEIVLAASGRKVNLQDLAPSNLKWKIILFVADAGNIDRVRAAAGTLDRSFPDASTADVYILGYGSDITDLATRLERLPGMDWTRVYADTPDAFTPAAGSLHEKFGVGSEGVIVIVRPDGYVGMLARLGERELNEDMYSYFSVFKT